MFWGTFMVNWAEPVGLIELGVIVVVQPTGVSVVESATKPV